MRKMLLVLHTSILLGVGAAALVGCSADDSSGNGNATPEPAYTFCAPATTCPPDVTGADLTTPVSFRNDIYTSIFLSSCSGGTSCHADNVTSGIGFGSTNNPLDDAGISSLVAQLKGQTSQVSNIVNVIPGDWQGSYLMMKIDGCQNEMGLSCNENASSLLLSVCDAACGDGMPASEGDTTNPNAYPLSETDRNKIRAWIAQGAEDN